jgi:hypothetical protein
VSEQIVEKARERTEEFIDEYPDRARLPMTRDPDETLLASYVVEEYREEHVEPDGEFETGFTVRRLDRAVPVSWAEAFFLTLIDRHQYDGGVSGRFLDRESGEEFNQPFHDAWTGEYAETQQAKTAGAQRQLMGGEYPEDHEQSARSGEYEPGEWENPVSILTGLTGSSVPDDERLPPVDHGRRVFTWTEELYDPVRNLVEYEWGVPSDRWAYMRSEDAHGVEDSAEVNAGYTHTHPVVWVDVAAAEGLPDLREEDLEALIEKAFHEKVVMRHVEECGIASEKAHDLDSVTASFGIEKPGAYAAGYALPGEEKPLIERSVEFIAWATTMRAMGRQRIARSQVMTDAAKADMCKQDADRIHGERLEYDHSRHNTKLVCACCGSAVGIGETMTAHRADDSETVAADGGEVIEEETAVVGARVSERVVDRPVKKEPSGRSLDGKTVDLGGGEDWCPACHTEDPESDECPHEAYDEHPIVEGSFGADWTATTGSNQYRGDGHLEIEYERPLGELGEYYREEVEEYVDMHGSPDSVAGVMGELGIPPEYRGVVVEKLGGGEQSSVESEPVEGPRRGSDTSRYELQELTAWNGDSETPNGGGGARYVDVSMPVEDVICGTRLQHVGSGERPKIVVRVDGERFATYNPQTAARKLVEAGLRIPWVADRSLEFEQCDRPEFERPVDRPGGSS